MLRHWSFRVDAQGNILRVGPDLAAALQSLNFHLRGTSAFDLMSVDEANRIWELFKPVKGQKPFVNLPVTLICPDASRLPIVASAAPRRRNGLFDGYVGVAFPITMLLDGYTDGVGLNLRVNELEVIMLLRQLPAPWRAAAVQTLRRFRAVDAGTHAQTQSLPLPG